jgi:hypothetical protein
MRYFFDTEFIEDGKTIDLISIGIVAEDGRELYLISNEYDESKASDWVKENVLKHIDKSEGISRADIKAQIFAFVGDKPEFWAYFADYDWIVMCQLFGRMIDLPEGWPMFCMDLKQLHIMKARPRMPTPPTEHHHALADAKWNEEFYKLLMKKRWYDV